MFFVCELPSSKVLEVTVEHGSYRKATKKYFYSMTENFTSDDWVFEFCLFYLHLATHTLSFII